MPIKVVATVAFSPCGSTEKVTRFLVKNLPVKMVNHNLTLPDSRKETLDFDNETLVFISFPVYGGLPKIAAEVFKCLHGQQTPCVYVAVRGDTEPGGFYHAMNDFAIEHGFAPVAAVAAVAHHTLMPSVSHGRPDASDAELLKKFGVQILQNANEDKRLTKIPGERGTIPDFAFYPHTDPDTCIRCGQCVENCPTGAIPEDDPTMQDNAICIQCSECAHVCPVDARSMGDVKAQEMLHKFATEQFANLHLETMLFL